jgi:microcystin-dependent protein
MATVSGITADEMQRIADTSVTSGAVDVNGNLVLQTKGGTPIQAGNVIGPITVGLVSMFAGATAPAGWLTCDGAAVSRTAYANLFNVVGTIYGIGDGTTTFNLPNLKGRVPVGRDTTQVEFDTLGETGGAKTHTLGVTEMPSHTHSQTGHTHTVGDTGHTHGQGGHTHSVTDNGHIHTQVPHNHTQPAHGHTVSDLGHNHTQDPHTHSLLYDMIFETGTNRSGFTSGGPNSTSGATVSATPTNNTATTGISVGTTTPQALGLTQPSINSADANISLGTTTPPAISSATTGVTVGTTTPPALGNTGGGAAHNNLQPYVVMNYIIKF